MTIPSCGAYRKCHELTISRFFVFNFPGTFTRNVDKVDLEASSTEIASVIHHG